MRRRVNVSCVQIGFRCSNYDPAHQWADGGLGSDIYVGTSQRRKINCPGQYIISYTLEKKTPKKVLFKPSSLFAIFVRRPK